MKPYSDRHPEAREESSSPPLIGQPALFSMAPEPEPEPDPEQLTDHEEALYAVHFAKTHVEIAVTVRKRIDRELARLDHGLDQELAGLDHWLAAAHGELQKAIDALDRAEA